MAGRNRDAGSHPDSGSVFSSVLLEILHFALVMFCFFHAGKRAQVAPLARSFILFAGVQAEFAGFEFADHIFMDAGCAEGVDLREMSYFEASSIFALPFGPGSSNREHCVAGCR